MDDAALLDDILAAPGDAKDKAHAILQSGYGAQDIIEVLDSQPGYSAPIAFYLCLYSQDSEIIQAAADRYIEQPERPFGLERLLYNHLLPEAVVDRILTDLIDFGVETDHLIQAHGGVSYQLRRADITPERFSHLWERWSHSPLGTKVSGFHTAVIKHWLVWAAPHLPAALLKEWLATTDNPFGISIADGPFVAGSLLVSPLKSVLVPLDFALSGYAAHYDMVTLIQAARTDDFMALWANRGQAIDVEMVLLGGFFNTDSSVDVALLLPELARRATGPNIRPVILNALPHLNWASDDVLSNRFLDLIMRVPELRVASMPKVPDYIRAHITLSN